MLSVYFGKPQRPELFNSDAMHWEKAMRVGNHDFIAAVLDWYRAKADGSFEKMMERTKKIESQLRKELEEELALRDATWWTSH